MAMMPKAPGLFSTTTGWPRIGRMCSPTMRITISVALPGPKGTSTLIGFDGYRSCAASSVTAPASSIADTASIPSRLMFPPEPCRRSRAAPHATRAGSLIGQLDLHLGDDLAPGGELVPEPGLRLLQRLVRLHAHELPAEAFLQRRRLRSLDDRPEQRGEDLLRRAGGRQHALPVQRADTGIAGLRQRRDVGVVR